MAKQINLRSNSLVFCESCYSFLSESRWFSITNLSLINKKKNMYLYFEYTPISSNFSGDSQKTVKLFLNVICNVVGHHLVFDLHHVSLMLMIS